MNRLFKKAFAAAEAADKEISTEGITTIEVVESSTEALAPAEVIEPENEEVEVEASTAVDKVIDKPGEEADEVKVVETPHIDEPVVDMPADPVEPATESGDEIEVKVTVEKPTPTEEPAPAAEETKVLKGEELEQYIAWKESQAVKVEEANVEDPAATPAEPTPKVSNEEPAKVEVTVSTPAAEEPAAEVGGDVINTDLEPVVEPPAQPEPVEEPKPAVEEPTPVPASDPADQVLAEAEAEAEEEAVVVDININDDVVVDILVGEKEEEVVMDMENADLIAGELSELADGIKLATTTALSLESIASSLVATKAEGGLNTQGVVMTQQAVDAALKPIGASLTLPAMESFQVEHGRMSATDYTIESIGETARKVWEAIKKFVLKWMNKIVSLVQATKAKAGRLEKAANQLAKEAKRLAGVDTEQGDLHGILLTGSLHRHLTVDGQTVNLVDDLADFTDLIEGGPKLTTGTYAVELFLEVLKGRNATATNLNEDVGVKASTMVAYLKAVGYEEIKGDKRLNGENTTYYGSKSVLGAVQAVVALVSSEDDIIIGLTTSIMDSATNIVAKKEVGLPSLPADEVEEIAKGVAKLAGSVVKVKVAEKEVAKINDKVTKEVDRLAGEVDTVAKEEDVDAADVEYAKRCLNSANLFIMASFDPEFSLARQAVLAGTASYSYAKRCLDNIVEVKA